MKLLRRSLKELIICVINYLYNLYKLGLFNNSKKTTLSEEWEYKEKQKEQNQSVNKNESELKKEHTDDQRSWSTLYELVMCPKVYIISA